MIQIFRHEQTTSATFGVLSVNGRLISFSLELPWRANHKFISCIPPGFYRVRRRDDWSGADRHGYTYQVEAVPGRDGILFHPANRPREIEGCIAPGLSIGDVGGVRGVLQSREAFALFRKALAGVEETLLHIQTIEGGVYHA